MIHLLPLITTILTLLSLSSSAPHNPHKKKTSCSPRKPWHKHRLPQTLAPKRQELESDHAIPWVRRVKIRSGPYKVPNRMEKLNGTDVHGMLDITDLNIEKPCAGYCTILRQWAGLEYANGKSVNIKDGMWLHHMVQFAVGPTRWDPVCFNRSSLPHEATSTLPSNAERYFSSGNERSVFDYNGGGEDMESGTGYFITPEDKFSNIVNLMNMNHEDKDVYVTMYYDFIDGHLPRGWNPTKVVWLDADACNTSEIIPPKQAGDFQLKSVPWKPNFEGRIVDSVGHLHDGGVAVDLMLDDERICTSHAVYSESEDYIFKGKEHGVDRTAREHISSMTPCRDNLVEGDDDKEDLWLRKDQALHLVGKYDYGKHEGNVENGSQGEIMAISLMIVEVPREGLSQPF